MKTARTLVGFLVGLVALGGEPAPACPVPSRTPLWELIGQAELIALVRVEAFEREPDSGAGSFESDVAVLKILETWKGSLRGAVRVNFSGNLSWGRRAGVGDRILLFLESGEEQVRRSLEADMAAVEEPEAEPSAGEEESETDVAPVSPEELLMQQEFDRRWAEHRMGRWFVAGNGSGVLAPEEAKVKPLRFLVDQAMRLQEAGTVSDELRREWLIQATALAETRQDAIEDLKTLLAAPESEGGGSASAQSRLSESDLRTIAESFVSDPKADASVPGLMSLLSGFEDEDVDRAAASMIGAGVAAPRIPGWIPEAIRQLVARRGWRDWGAEIWQRHVEDGTLREVWPAVARDLRLSAVVPARLLSDEKAADRRD